MGRRYADRVSLVSLVLLLMSICCSCARSGEDKQSSGENARGVRAAYQLSPDDIDLYLELMRAAAARVNNLLPADKTALGRMSRMQDDIAAGRVPAPVEGDPEAEVLGRGTRVQQALDLVIAEERGMDVDRYIAVRDLIESIVNPSGVVPDEAYDGSDKTMTPSQAQILLANKKHLAPHAPEIERLYQVVRRSLVGNPPK